MGFAAVARVTESRWIACAVRDNISFGLKPGDELKVETTICDEIRASGHGVVIDHVAEDPAFRDHRTPAMYGFQSYISIPIVLADGTFFGTLCAIDPHPAKVNTPEVVNMFRLFASLIAFHLQAQERVATSEAALLNHQQADEIREQFIAVLAHDLRNPLASIDAGMRLLLKEPLNEKSMTYVGLLQNSVKRMAALIDDVLDFARARLGGGFRLKRSADAQLLPALEQVVNELRAAWPDRVIQTDFAINRGINSDPARIAQLLSNLVGNALKHGDGNSPIRVSAATDSEGFELSVANGGTPISPAVIERLFQPFFRVAHQSTYEGLGLGLYIAAEIARAHNGKLEVTSSAAETRFTFRIPRC
ncbi:GAF domain-containing sensor histidine kinase [Bradyrhizobium sp. AUGA SZCCT0051]|nr:GAF domain-containing sensor histidine kinase [Bradyrhizobium sp. AUGA SZCCT0124]MBR1314681.1 GAF domain-containing sensor histidine kinase [Bradyrhizobium sp. AUGA SZCCT0051]MBR1345333.1 GAF domain-containing sensor histidine kinase [Bradyrhizobium sp. AUGA SZCCT0105]MBR1359964.1 GAF domain-containing sensor histidine kinase [Bradyrhizobium sp. AUGA SZCCT0045]